MQKNGPPIYIFFFRKPLLPTIITLSVIALPQNMMILLQKCSQSRFCVFAKDLPHKNVDNAIKMPEIEFIERLLMLFCFYVFLYPSMQQSFFAFLIGNCISIVRNFIFSGVRVTNPLHFKCFYCIQN